VRLPREGIIGDREFHRLQPLQLVAQPRGFLEFEIGGGFLHALLEFEEAARLRDELKRLQAVELAIADDPFARQSDVERSVGDAFMKAVRDGAPKSDERGPKHQKTSRTRMKRAGRPNVPKTFGSRSR